VTALVAIHAVVAVWLALYGLSFVLLAYLFLRHRQAPERAPDLARDCLPPVTVQIPVYNEVHVIERVIDAAAGLDYPRDRLEIQILDDSDDATTALAEARAAAHRERGVQLEVLHRPDRKGFKAGALAWGLTHASGDLILVLDADFVPRPDFLLRMVPRLANRPRLGMVQARWSFLNTGYSRLTQAQALALEGHFVVEQSARHWSGLLMSNNGSGGIWRRECIADSGGWSSTTLCEDLDLSYRAQLAGWECAYAPDVDVPAELPPQIAAFKRQQARWAQGSIQCLRKLAPSIGSSPRLDWRQKAMALVHMSSYLAHPLMVVLLAVSLPLLLVPASAQLPIGGLGIVYLGPPFLYAVAQKHLGRDWVRRMKAFPFVALLGVGIAWCNTKAAFRGLTTWGGRFRRTPKFRIEDQEGGWETSSYRLRLDDSTAGEIALAVYGLITALVAVAVRRYTVIPFVLLYAAGFGMVAGLEIAQALSAKRQGGPLRGRATRAPEKSRNP
jgi:cellulose synthase/poly-beta-1,6-N-acetylglucosamine synthase-like glycosyltransferase